jgi:hypothetical protein
MKLQWILYENGHKIYLRISDTRNTQPLYEDALTGRKNIDEWRERWIDQHL